MKTEGAPQETLNGWKEIAAFLGKSVRSVQRWERDLALPVHRINTPDHGQIVYASRTEIEAWRRRLDRPGGGAPAAPEPVDLPERIPLTTPAESTAAGEQPAMRTAAPPSPRRHVAALALLLVVTLFAGVWLGRWLERRRPAGVSYVQFVGSVLQAVSSGGDVVWTHEFGEPVNLPPGTDPLHSDLDGDGAVELIVPVRVGPANTRRPARSDRVVCFRSDGTVRWELDPSQRLEIGGQTFTGPWHVRAMVSPGGGAGDGRTWIAFNHHLWSPAFVSEVAPSGTASVRFAQSGWITALTHWQTAAGPLLVAGGVNNDQASAALAFLHLHDEPAQFAGGGEHHIACEGCPRKPPLRYILLPPTELITATDQPYALVDEMSTEGDALRFVTGDGLLGVVTPDLQIGQLAFADQHWAAHRSLEASGKIAHPAEKCPERVQPREVPMWTERDGWTKSTVVPVSIMPPPK